MDKKHGPSLTEYEKWIMFKSCSNDELVDIYFTVGDMLSTDGFNALVDELYRRNMWNQALHIRWEHMNQQ